LSKTKQKQPEVREVSSMLEVFTTCICDVGIWDFLLVDRTRKL